MWGAGCRRRLLPVRVRQGWWRPAAAAVPLRQGLGQAWAPVACRGPVPAPACRGNSAGRSYFLDRDRVLRPLFMPPFAREERVARVERDVSFAWPRGDCMLEARRARF
jgi:hypothetical protein